ncbi:MAG: malto-oligosyltrehalose trehalohydrolase [Vicinamibacterales bacterium]
MPNTWEATLGAVPEGRSTSFRVWAPTSEVVELVLEPSGVRRSLARHQTGMFYGSYDDVSTGDRYRYSLDGEGPFPDPSSRWQPDGVHGASVVVDPHGFAWTDRRWTGLPLVGLVFYELHVGTFSPAGTFAGATTLLPQLQDLGVTALELMPVADFPGARNWGYDGVCPFAPAHAYGTPDDLRRFVDAAHALGLAVFLDVVYNHTGPDGSYLGRFSPYYFSRRHASPWGAGINLDGAHAAPVRQFFIENALHWIHEYHMDGVRLDATHAIQDDGPRHFLAELAAGVHESVSDRLVHVIAEDHRNLAVMTTPSVERGWGLDAVWADDFHHQMRRLLAGDRDGYYRDFTGTTADIATTVRQGWFFTGQYSEHLQEHRGTAPTSLPPERFVVCLQNHDQVGNRALGDRLHHGIEAAAYRAASVLLLTLPQTPLLFMGQEWAASSPFLYFTDHEPALGRLVTEGRRREFKDFAAFADEQARQRIPDPQELDTFLVSRLDWAERSSEPHASTLALYRAVLAFRRSELAPESSTSFDIHAIDTDTLVMKRTCRDGRRALVVVRLRGAGGVDVSGHASVGEARGWTVALTSADWSAGVSRPTVEGAGATLAVRFHEPAAVIFTEVRGFEERVAPGAATQGRNVS